MKNTIKKLMVMGVLLQGTAGFAASDKSAEIDITSAVAGKYSYELNPKSAAVTCNPPKMGQGTGKTNAKCTVDTSKLTNQSQLLLNIVRTGGDAGRAQCNSYGLVENGKFMLKKGPCFIEGNILENDNKIVLP